MNSSRQRAGWPAAIRRSPWQTAAWALLGAIACGGAGAQTVYVSSEKDHKVNVFDAGGKLQSSIDTAMGAEFLSQDVDFRIGDARIVGDDGGRLVVQATGIAQFDRNEQAPVTVRALFDRTSNRWIDTQYDFDVVAMPPRSVAMR